MKLSYNLSVRTSVCLMVLEKATRFENPFEKFALCFICRVFVILVL